MWHTAYCRWRCLYGTLHTVVEEIFYNEYLCGTLHTVVGEIFYNECLCGTLHTVVTEEILQCGLTQVM